MITKTQIKYLRSLHLKKNRDREHVYFAEGVKIVNEALSSHIPGIKMLLYTPENERHIKKEILPHNTTSIELKEEDFRKISYLKNPQGVFMLMEKPVNQIPEISEFKDIILILDSIRDPGNLGTIIRLADWFDIRQIICSIDCVDCYSPKVVQATMGAIFRVDIFYTPLEKFLSVLHKSGKSTIYGSSLDGKNIYKTQLKTPASIILGNEAHGISHSLHHYIDKNILIPNFNNSINRSESLNVSLAAAIICSEFRRMKV